MWSFVDQMTSKEFAFYVLGVPILIGLGGGMVAALIWNEPPCWASVAILGPFSLLS